MNRYFANRMLHPVLWHYVDHETVSAADQQRILKALDALKPVDRLAKALLVQGTNNEIGEESDYRGYPKLVGFVFAFTGRGALDSAKQLIPLLNKPPYQVRERVRALGGHRFGGYNVNRFVDNAIAVYRMHAREAIMG